MLDEAESFLLKSSKLAVRIESEVSLRSAETENFFSLLFSYSFDPQKAKNTSAVWQGIEK